MTQPQENSSSPPPPSSRKIVIAILVVAFAVAIAWIATSDMTQMALLKMRSTTEIERAVREDPQSPWPAYMLGVRYARSGRLTEAIKLFERARQAAPDSFDVRFALGKAYALTNNSDAALTELKKASELSPRNAQVFRFIARVDRLLGDTTAAKDAAKRATTLDPGDAEAWYQFGVLFPPGASKESEGRRYLKKAAELKPDNGVYAFAYGQSLADTAQFADAVPYLRKAVAFLPQDPTAHFLLALALHRNGGSGDIDQAVSELKRALNLQPNDFRAHFELANIALEQRKYAVALPELRIASRLAPIRPEVWAALRTAADRTGGKSEAAEAQTHFEALRKDHIEMETLQHHLAQQPNDAVAEIRVGQLMEKLGSLQSAGLYYASVVQRDPSNLKARALLENLQERIAAANKRSRSSNEGLRK